MATALGYRLQPLLHRLELSELLGMRRKEQPPRGGTLQGPSPSADPTVRGHRRGRPHVEMLGASLSGGTNGRSGWTADLPDLPEFRCR